MSCIPFSDEEIAFLYETKELISSKVYELYKQRFPGIKRSYGSLVGKKCKLNLCKAEEKKLYWTKDKVEFIRKHDNGNIEESFKLFCEHFKDDPTTETAYRNQRSRMHIAKSFTHGSTKIRPLYSEHVKKDLVYIKVAQPNTWISKARWVYLETHPGEVDDPDYYFIFLDGNNRNFDPDNIYKIHKRVLPVVISLGGMCKGDPEKTKIRCIQAKLRVTQMDLMEKKGMCYTAANHTRIIKNEYK